MAQAAEYQRLLQDAQAQVPGSIPTGLRAALFATLKDFLDMTNAWQEDIDVDIVANDTAYTLTPPTAGRINRLLLLYNSTDTEKRWVSPVRMDVPGDLVLLRVPNAAATWVAKVAKVVKDPVDCDGNPEIESWILQKYWDTLLQGVVGNMLNQGGKGYSDRQGGAIAMRRYINGRSLARREIMSGNVFGNQTWSFPQTWGTGSQSRGGWV